LRGAELEGILAATVVDATVARLVYTVLLEDRRTGIARESAEVAGRLHGLLERRAEVGESSPLEVTRARTEWFARRRDLLDAEAAARAARFALRILCGNWLPEDFLITETLLDAKAIDLPGDLVGRLRARNPLLIRARTAVEEAQAATEVARRDVFPLIEMFGGHETELDREGWSAGIGLTIPLWDRNRGAIDAASAQQSIASAEVRALALELENALEQAGAAYRRALGAIRLHQEGWTSAAGRSLEIVTFSFENGEASLLDVLDAQRSYLGVGLAEAESWAALAFARSDIERLTAGPLASEDTDEAP
jgi:cobalt-zinc-cadmium efflux system outer membrane protein